MQPTGRDSQYGYRYDDWLAIRQMERSHTGQTVLIIGGGKSANNWREVAADIKPDVLIGVNGVLAAIGDELGYWITTETNSAYASWFKCNIHPRRFIHWQLKEMKVCLQDDIAVRPYTLEDHPETDLRRYYNGLIQGSFSWRLRDQTGTTMMPALHLAGILGFNPIYTIGWDLCIGSNDTESHHWYQENLYRERAGIENDVDRQFYMHQGVLTLPHWHETAKWLNTKIKPLCKKNEVDWQDLSNGLIELTADEEWTA